MSRLEERSLPYISGYRLEGYKKTGHGTKVEKKIFEIEKKWNGGSFGLEFGLDYRSVDKVGRILD